MQFETLIYSTDGRVATITLNRPDRFNAIADPMPQEIAQAVTYAEADDDIHAIVVQGAGKGFCGGYDLVDYAEAEGDIPGSQEMPWDPTVD